MARVARADLFDPAEVSVFHCINRCVRRCFLCGDDPLTGANYDHRKVWLEERLAFLAGQFGIDVLGFSILSNHFHLILRNRPDVVAGWSDTEVATRWLMLCPVRKTAKGTPAAPTEAELDGIRNVPERLRKIRRRLSDIGWFMRMIAEPIARRANREDRVNGRFWQGRFRAVKSRLAAARDRLRPPLPPGGRRAQDTGPTQHPPHLPSRPGCTTLRRVRSRPICRGDEQAR